MAPSKKNTDDAKPHVTSKRIIDMIKEATGSNEEDVCTMLQLCGGDANLATVRLLETPFEKTLSKAEKKKLKEEERKKQVQDRRVSDAQRTSSAGRGRGRGRSDAGRGNGSSLKTRARAAGAFDPWSAPPSNEQDAWANTDQPASGVDTWSADPAGSNAGWGAPSNSWGAGAASTSATSLQPPAPAATISPAPARKGTLADILRGSSTNEKPASPAAGPAAPVPAQDQKVSLSSHPSFI